MDVRVGRLEIIKIEDFFLLSKYSTERFKADHYSSVEGILLALSQELGAKVPRDLRPVSNSSLKSWFNLEKNCSPWKKFAHLGRASISASRCSLFPSCRLLGFLDWKQVNFKDTMIKTKTKNNQTQPEKGRLNPSFVGGVLIFHAEPHMVCLTNNEEYFLAWQTTKDIFWPGKQPKIWFNESSTKYDCKPCLSMESHLSQIFWRSQRTNWNPIKIWSQLTSFHLFSWSDHGKI